MPKTKLQAATVGGTADEVEVSFYEALQAGDLDRLMACWADEDDIVCVHPGGGRLVGAAAIRASFEALFAGGHGVAVMPTQVCRVESLTSAMHNLIEQIRVQTHEGSGLMYAVVTHVYQRTAQGWRLVAHHGSPGETAPVETTGQVSEPPQVFH